MEKIEFIQSQTINLLQEQEKLIVKDLNSELNSYQKLIFDLKAQNSNKTVAAKKESLHDEILYYRAQVEIIEQKNNFLHKSNKELKIEYKSYENELNILNSNIEALNSQNLRLKNELRSLKDKQLMTKTTDFTILKSQTANTERVLKSSDDLNYITSLKKMIDLEKKNLRAAKNAYSRELQERKQLEDIIRLAIADVAVSSSFKDDKEKKPTKKQILRLLFSKTFPVKRNKKIIQQEEIDSDLLIKHLDKNIENIEKLYSQHEEQIHCYTER